MKLRFWTTALLTTVFVACAPAQQSSAPVSEPESAQTSDTTDRSLELAIRKLSDIITWRERF